ncbi:putative transcription factor hoxa13 [Pseudohyphozyma bogoriensis]|nr:putative transcription factor hoxa13 [Pseudohyphozyma bogoriensis]
MMAPRKRSSSQGDNDFTLGPDGSPSPPPRTGSARATTPAGSSSNGGTPDGKRNGGFKEGTPIKFYAEEVERMHAELDKRDKDKRSSRAVARPTKSSGVTFKGFLARVAVFYVLIAYFLVCPSDTSRDRAVCRSLDSLQSHLKAYEPTVRPYYLTAQRKLDPYLARLDSHAAPYINTVKPYYLKADSTVRPYANLAVDKYRTVAHPKILSGIRASQAATKPYADVVRKHYGQTLAPSVEWYSKAGKQWYGETLEPWVNLADLKTRYYSKMAYDYTSPLYYQGVPLASKHFHHSVVPFARSSYRTTHKVYFDQVHPRAIVAGGHAHGFYKAKILPALQRFYSLYIAPQVDKITEKIFEYRVKKETSEAAAHVLAAEDEILHEKGLDDLDEFIAELRDTTYTTPKDAVGDAPPAPPTETKIPTAEKRAMLESLSTMYEKEIAKLGSVEQDLLVQRLTEIRSNAVDDVPKRFGAILTALDDEGDKMVGKLSKYFTKVSGDEKLSTEEKVEESEFIARKAVAKVHKMVEDGLEEANAYRAALSSKEWTAVQKATDALTTLVGKAQEELGFGWTWLDDVTHKDWTRYHKLASAEKNWKEYYTGLSTGAIKDGDLAKYDPVASLEAIETEIADIALAFETLMDKLKIKGQKELKGEWTGISNEAAKAYDVVGGKLADAVEAVKSSASSLAGVTPTPTNYQESASSYASVAQESASAVIASAYEAIPTIPPVAIPTEAIVEGYASATENVGSAVEHVASVVDSAAQAVVTEVPEVLASVYSMASSLGDAALLAAGATASKLGAGATDALSSASSAASSAASSVSSAASSLVDEPVFATSVEPSFASKISAAVAEATSSASSVASEASQAVVGTPAPTGVAASASSIAKKVSSAVSSASSSAEAVLSTQVESVKSAVHDATRSTPEGVKEHATSVASVVSSKAVRAKKPLAKKVASVSKSAEAVVSSVKSVVHDKTRTTPEGVREHATSVVAAASSKAASLKKHVEL